MFINANKKYSLNHELIASCNAHINYTLQLVARVHLLIYTESHTDLLMFY